MESEEDKKEATEAKLTGVKAHRALTRGERKARNRRLLAIGFGTVFAVSLVFLSFSQLLKSLPDEEAKVKVKPKAPLAKERTQAKKKRPKAKPVVRKKKVKKKLPTKPVRKGPARLKASWQVRDPNSLVLRSNAVRGDKIELIFSAATGTVVGTPSFYMKRKLLWKGEGQQKVSLKAWKLPIGHVKVSGNYDGARFSLSTYTGGTDPNFESRLRRYKKSISYFQQVERDQLYRITRGYLQKAEALLGAKRRRLKGKRWKAFYRDWKASLSTRWDRELKGFSEKRRNRYSFPELWLELKELRGNLEREALALYQKSHKTRATASISPVVAEYRDLKRKVSRLSVWR